MIRKVITKTNESNSHNIHYVGGKQAHTAPVILESFVNDDMEIEHILANGNTTLDTAYMAMWGKPKGIMNLDKKYKGENPDKTRIK
jgi:uncharacterized Fe-S radical SAM superfamily protein PflX